jgi:hypothetical protein
MVKETQLANDTPRQASSVTRPSDVFSGTRVRRRFTSQVLDVIERTATVHRIFIEGTMVSSSQGDEWALPSGTALRTPSFWGRPSSLFVEGEEARAVILKALGVNLSRSPTYRKYC